MSCTCGNCKHFDRDEDYCRASADEVYDQDTCDNWEDKVELTEEEKAEVAGDIEAHRRMVEGDGIN